MDWDEMRYSKKDQTALYSQTDCVKFPHFGVKSYAKLYISLPQLSLVLLILFVDCYHSWKKEINKIFPHTDVASQSVSNFTLMKLLYGF